MADREERRILNTDCLRHIFRYLSPREWITFTEVHTSWKLAADSTDFETFTYDDIVRSRLFLSCVNNPGIEIPHLAFLDIFEFVQLLTLVAPKLKYAKINTHRFEKKKDEYVIVEFGRFEYCIKVNKATEKLLMHIFVKQAKSIETLKINSFCGAKKNQWENFFRVNPLNFFKFRSSHPDDHKLFFRDYISMLPNTLEQIVLILNGRMKNLELQKILQFLQRQPRLSNLQLLSVDDISSIITKAVSKHENAIKELCLLQQVEEFFVMLEEDLKWMIPNFINTKLSLRRLTLWDDESNKIADNCRSIQALKLLNCYFLEIVLKSLPNLTELHINPMKMNFKDEIKNLQSLTIVCNENQVIDYENIASALALMPNLSSLTWRQIQNEIPECTGRKIKQIIHSRGQNIVVYFMRYMIWQNNTERIKLGEVACGDTASTKEFAFTINSRNITGIVVSLGLI